MIDAAMRHDRFGRPGLAGYLLDTARSTLAWSGMYAAAVVAPVRLGVAGAPLAGLVTAAALVVAVPDYLTWCGLPAGWVARVRAVGWVALLATLAAVLGLAPAVVVGMVGSFGALIGAGLGFARAVSWLDAHAEELRLAAGRALRRLVGRG